MRNDELIDSVKDELARDPNVDSDAIPVSADDGVVRLRGTAGSLFEKREAERDAKRVSGVELVDNKLQLRPLSNREDADLRGDVLQALARDGLAPATVDARVRDGVVRLTGTADWQDQRDAAESVAASVVGAIEVVSEIALTPKPNAQDVREAIGVAFKRNARARADGFSVTTSGGTVTVKGKVSSWEERDAAIEATRSAPGVTSVQDHITVEY
jgi:osmotically-inducible protein OsmY